MRKFLVGVFTISFFAMGCSDDGQAQNNAEISNKVTNNNTIKKNRTTSQKKTNQKTTQTKTTNNNQTTTKGGTTASSNICTAEGRTVCFLNSDCLATERCQNVSTTNVIFPCCIPGERGTKKVGVDCTGDDDTTCESGLCINRNPANNDVFLCGGACMKDKECPNNMECKSVATGHGLILSCVQKGV